jgi:outer membrane protein assembly factor BamB
VIRSVVAGVLSLAAVFFGWRVLAPAELLAPASSPYPALVLAEPAVTGRSNVAPLIVDDRIRVFAAKRQVRADAPVDAKSVNTPHWSFRRWPQQLSGVAAIGPTVITRWSDGKLIAIDGRTGEIAWRADGPPAPGYTGHRTGASTVWAPTGLHTAGGAVVITEGQELLSYDGSTGTRRWQTDVPAACADGFTTAGEQYVCATGAYHLATGMAATDWPPGPYTPVGCDVAASHCAGLRDGAGQGWTTTGSHPVRAPALDDPAATVAAGLVLTVTGTAVVAADPSGARRWTTSGIDGGQVLGATAQDVLVLTPARDLWLLDVRTGVRRTSFPLRVKNEKTAWKPGLYQVTGHYVAIERLDPTGPADPDKPDHYFAVDTDILATV